jgi:DNA-binding response OmpR family regulator
MVKSKELILLIESDPDISDVIARQSLQPLGYDVKVVDDANNAIKVALQLAPDLVIADINSSGLSGKDLLVAFGAQKFEFPIVVLAEKEQESEVMQTLRLGASDYLLWPARETEVVNVVERGLKQIRGANDRRQLDDRLKETDKELEDKTRNLETILAIGKFVASINDQRILFNRIVAGAMLVSSADIGWLLLRDEKNPGSFLLTAQRNLPPAWAKKINKPLDDGVSPLVSLSGETLEIHGEPLKRFKVSALGKAVAVVPIKARKEVIGLLVVVRKSEKAVTKNEESLLEAVADQASISLVNAQLFRALQQSADASYNSEKRQTALFEALRGSLQEELKTVQFSVDLLKAERIGLLSQGQKKALETAQTALDRLQKIAE